ncbi:DUF6712 family protein [uncultured Bacteroides sp.]|jgi:hypothetical protein|uniref:DUF6712 family protein n=1 Tax=uncultured Bacteroides sp. TaxID=162156 RepID=UPI0025F437F9|nr:DUF6712 family protein [uncultured Bacteroides sp.]
MKMIIDKQTFEKVVFAAASANVYVFDAIQDRFEQAEHKLFGTVLGSDTDVDTLPVKEDVCRYICLDAFYQAIPGLDLILTDTGFGIVNNQNISPASRDRVESLRVQIQREADYALDCIIEGMTGDDAWSSSVCARLVISSLYYTGAHVRDFAGRPTAIRTDLLELRPQISEAEEYIRREISAVLFDHLLEQIRHKSLAEIEIPLVCALRRAIGSWINKQLPAFRVELANVVNLLERCPDDFPAYKDSDAYKVKHFEYYKNEKEDTCYFWG